jgi:DNA-binding transcriptional LysR family regulator
VDLAVRIGVLRDSTMVATRTASVRRVVCASPSYLASSGMPKVPTDLTMHACVTFDVLTSSTVWSFARAGSRLSVNTAEAAIDAAVAGVGLTRVLSYQAAKAVAESKLTIVLAKYELEPLPVSLVHLEQTQLPLKTRALFDFLASRIRRRATKANLLTR